MRIVRQRRKLLDGGSRFEVSVTFESEDEFDKRFDEECMTAIV